MTIKNTPLFVVSANENYFMKKYEGSLNIQKKKIILENTYKKPNKLLKFIKQLWKL